MSIQIFLYTKNIGIIYVIFIKFYKIHRINSIMKKNKFRGIFNKISFFKDRKFKEPRVWSNQELKKFGFIFQGDIVNISGWKDMDKEGNRYKEYFKNAKSYQISNYNTQKNGFQGDMENEFFRFSCGGYKSRIDR